MTPDLIGPAGLLAEVEELWDEGLPPGDKTGWPSIDKHYTVAPGQFTVITGWPGSGKSEWLDALLVNLMHQGWHTAIYSPENQPIKVHAVKLLEKLSGKPFGPGPTERLTKVELRELIIHMLAGRFSWVSPADEESLTAKKVIVAAEPWLSTFPNDKRALVMDPWNELEHSRPPQLSETEYVSQQLSFVRRWARANGVHVFMVAHPRNARRADDGKLPVPRPDMISGSQHWWNKADANITVWRDMEKQDSQIVDIHIQKVRFKHIGRPGVASLRYDRVTGRYHEIPAPSEVRRYAGKGALE